MQFATVSLWFEQVVPRHEDQVPTNVVTKGKANECQEMTRQRRRMPKHENLNRTRTTGVQHHLLAQALTNEENKQITHKTICVKIGFFQSLEAKVYGMKL